MSTFDEKTVRTIPQIASPVGRPRKWQSLEDLQEAVQYYFDGCFVPRTREKKVIEKDDEGNEFTEYVTVPVLNKHEEPTFYQIRPFTVTGLALSLDMTRQGLLDYEKKPSHAEFADTIKKAKLVIESYNEERLHGSSQVTGAIFNLKNNYSWVDKTETDLTSKGKSITPEVAQAKAAAILGRGKAVEEEVTETKND
jgi:hypothetical protein